MGRKQKNNAEWFPHYIPKIGTRMSILEERFSLQGYAAYFKLLELLTLAEDHFLDFNVGRYRLNYQSRIKASDEVFEAIMKLLVDLEIIDAELYAKKIVYCEDLVNSLSELYRKRGRPLPTKSDVMQVLNLSQKNAEIIPEHTNLSQKGDRNTQSRVEKSRVKESKEEKRKYDFASLVFPFDSDEFKAVWELWLKYKKETFRFSYKTIESHQAALEKIGKMSNGNLEYAIHLIKYAIERQWQGFFHDKNYESGKQRSHSAGQKAGFSASNLSELHKRSNGSR